MKFPILTIKNLKELNPKKISKMLKKYKALIVRGYISKNKLIKIKASFEKKFNQKNDRIRPPGKYNQIKKNYQRVIIGMSGGLVQSRTNSRLMRTFYNPLYCRDIYNMHEIFNKMLLFQNKLYGLPENYGNKQRKTKHNLFVASRINHYPAGGGFLSLHKDTSAAISIKNYIKNYFQILLTMSKKGKDYKEGGGIVYKNQKIYCFDDYTEIGDMILYNGQTIHGVKDVDPHKHLDMKKIRGRLTAAVTLFKY